MKKVLAFAGSTSSTSINKKIATFAAQNLQNNSFDVVDLRDFNVPIFSEDEEKENGHPEDAKRFTALLDNYDGFIVSLAEHNGSYAAAFKNIFDWSTRIEKNFFRNKPLLLMATSPGGRGGITVLNTAVASFPHMGAKSITSFSLPSFYDNFKESKIVNEEQLAVLKEKVKAFESKVNE
ncbi:MAG: NAD(P)H-dependent oxidoreductase [Polaribacter sp.]|uniref:NADPH-dependent FMN reductase n=1 Tax=Polaribacter sp. TaxID=1920175 RepID=UPI003BAF1CBF